MLTTIRERAQSWVAAFIIVLLSISFALWGIQYYTSTHAKKQSLAKVGSFDITEGEVRMAYNRLRRAWQMNTGRSRVFNSAIGHALYKQALDERIARRVLVNAAQTSGFFVPLALVEEAVNSLPIFQDKSGQFSIERFSMLLPRLGYTQAYFFSDVSQNLLIDQIRTGILKSALSFHNEVADIEKMILQARTMRYVHLPVSEFSKGISIPKSMAKEYYEKNKQSFKSPEKISIAFIQLSSKALSKNIDVTTQDLKTFYANNIDLYTEVRKISLPKGKQKTESKVLSFEKVKKKIKQAVIRQRVEEQFSEKLDQLADLTYTQPSTLEPAAKALGLRVQVTDLFSRKGGKKGTIAANPRVISAAFSDAVLHELNNSQPIQLSDGSSIVLRLKKHKVEGIKPFSSVSNEVTRILKKKLAEHKAKLLASKLLNDLQKNHIKHLKNLMHRYALSWEVKTNFTRKLDFKEQEKNAGLAPVLINAAFSMSLSKNKSTSVKMLQLDGGDYALVELLGVKSLAPKSASVNNKAIEQRWQKGLAEFEYSLYFKALKDKAKITIYEHSADEKVS